MPEITPLTSVDRLLPPASSSFAPSEKLPAPSIEPAVMPPDDRLLMTKSPPASVMNRAVPPEVVSRKLVNPPFFVVIVALPATAELRKISLAEFVMTELPAVLVSAKFTKPLPPLLLMIALPAVLDREKVRTAALFSVSPPLPVLLMVALAALLVFVKKSPAALRPAVAVLLIVAVPALLEFSKLMAPRVTLLIIAFAAVLAFWKVRVEFCRRLLLSGLMFSRGAFEELLTIPVPPIVRKSIV